MSASNQTSKSLVNTSSSLNIQNAITNTLYSILKSVTKLKLINNVSILSGRIDDCVIGAVKSATGYFTSVNTPFITNLNSRVLNINNPIVCIGSGIDSLKDNGIYLNNYNTFIGVTTPILSNEPNIVSARQFPQTTPNSNVLRSFECDKLFANQVLPSIEIIDFANNGNIVQPQINLDKQKTHIYNVPFGQYNTFIIPTGSFDGQQKRVHYLTHTLSPKSYIDTTRNNSYNEYDCHTGIKLYGIFYTVGGFFREIDLSIIGTYVDICFDSKLNAWLILNNSSDIVAN